MIMNVVSQTSQISNLELDLEEQRRKQKLWEIEQKRANLRQEFEKFISNNQKIEKFDQKMKVGYEGILNELQSRNRRSEEALQGRHEQIELARRKRGENSESEEEEGAADQSDRDFGALLTGKHRTRKRFLAVRIRELEEQRRSIQHQIQNQLFQSQQLQHQVRNQEQKQFLKSKQVKGVEELNSMHSVYYRDIEAIGHQSRANFTTKQTERRLVEESIKEARQMQQLYLSKTALDRKRYEEELKHVEMGHIQLDIGIDQRRRELEEQEQCLENFRQQEDRQNARRLELEHIVTQCIPFFAQVRRIFFPGGLAPQGGSQELVERRIEEFQAQGAGQQQSQGFSKRGSIISQLREEPLVRAPAGRKQTSFVLSSVRRGQFHLQNTQSNPDHARRESEGTHLNVSAQNAEQARGSPSHTGCLQSQQVSESQVSRRHSGRASLRTEDLAQEILEFWQGESLAFEDFSRAVVSLYHSLYSQMNSLETSYQEKGYEKNEKQLVLHQLEAQIEGLRANNVDLGELERGAPPGSLTLDNERASLDSGLLLFGGGAPAQTFNTLDAEPGRDAELKTQQLLLENQETISYVLVCLEEQLFRLTCVLLLLHENSDRLYVPGSLVEFLRENLQRIVPRRAVEFHRSSYEQQIQKQQTLGLSTIFGLQKDQGLLSNLIRASQPAANPSKSLINSSNSVTGKRVSRILNLEKIKKSHSVLSEDSENVQTTRTSLGGGERTIQEIIAENFPPENAAAHQRFAQSLRSDVFVVTFLTPLDVQNFFFQLSHLRAQSSLFIEHIHLLKDQAIENIRSRVSYLLDYFLGLQQHLQTEFQLKRDLRERIAQTRPPKTNRFILAQISQKISQYSNYRNSNKTNPDFKKPSTERDGSVQPTAKKTEIEDQSLESQPFYRYIKDLQVKNRRKIIDLDNSKSTQNNESTDRAKTFKHILLSQPTDEDINNEEIGRLNFQRTLIKTDRGSSREEQPLGQQSKLASSREFVQGTIKNALLHEIEKKSFFLKKIKTLNTFFDQSDLQQEIRPYQQQQKDIMRLMNQYSTTYMASTETYMSRKKHAVNLRKQVKEQQAQTMMIEELYSAKNRRRAPLLSGSKSTRHLQTTPSLKGLGHNSQLIQTQSTLNMSNEEDTSHKARRVFLPEENTRRIQTSSQATRSLKPDSGSYLSRALLKSEPVNDQTLKQYLQKTTLTSRYTQNTKHSPSHQSTRPSDTLDYYYPLKLLSGSKPNNSLLVNKNH